MLDPGLQHPLGVMARGYLFFVVFGLLVALLITGTQIASNTQSDTFRDLAGQFGPGHSAPVQLYNTKEEKGRPKMPIEPIEVEPLSVDKN